MILKWDMPHNEYFYFLYFKYILLVTLLCFCSSQNVNAGLLYFYSVKVLSSSFTSAAAQ